MEFYQKCYKNVNKNEIWIYLLLPPPGVLMANATKIENLAGLLRLWYHENCRVFQDRLVNDEDRHWFHDLLKEKVTTVFEANADEVVPKEGVLYGDFMIANVDNKVYGPIEDPKKVCVHAYA